MTPPVGNTLSKLQNNCEGVVVLLVDERSLVGCCTLGWMEYMCRYAMNSGSFSSSSWGGLPVVVFLGDDVQLPPVCGSPVYNCKSNKSASLHGALVWKEFNVAITLSNIIRQNQNETQLKDSLMALRDYKLSPEQAKWLQNFQWDTLKRSHGQPLLNRMSENSLFVLTTHPDEWAHNKQQLLKANQLSPIAKLQAVDQGQHSKTSNDSTNSLLKTLFLCRGAKVMLTVNLNVKYGLFNGSMGEVVDILYFNNNTPYGNFPDVVMVEFTKYTGPPFLKGHPKLVPVVPVERKIDCHCYSYKRKQIPLRLGWWTTIHRCQGMTIGKGEANRYIVIHPGNKTFEARNPGAVFVALSRAKSTGVDREDPDFAWNPNILVNEDRLCLQVNTETTKARSKEIDRIFKLSQKTKTNYAHLLDTSNFSNIEYSMEEK
ncbi:ATP-dependent DNA helicase PIF1-like [Ostrea edulis]|uniref:ATP-dependent DNA helicase PIF1-like n=1 Tax=Ostrea edulis TaxID=37623 RepID=UPI0024AFC7DC|nr:ATP-dependent DNA helicase PIF1-like [Ostrea edulis]